MTHFSPMVVVDGLTTRWSQMNHWKFWVKKKKSKTALKSDAKQNRRKDAYSIEATTLLSYKPGHK